MKKITLRESDISRIVNKVITEMETNIDRTLLSKYENLVPTGEFKHSDWVKDATVFRAFTFLDIDYVSNTLRKNNFKFGFTGAYQFMAYNDEVIISYTEGDIDIKYSNGTKNIDELIAKDVGWYKDNM